MIKKVPGQVADAKRSAAERPPLAAGRPDDCRRPTFGASALLRPGGRIAEEGKRREERTAGGDPVAKPPLQGSEIAPVAHPLAQEKERCERRAIVGFEAQRRVMGLRGSSGLVEALEDRSQLAVQRGDGRVTGKRALERLACRF